MRVSAQDLTQRSEHCEGLAGQLAVLRSGQAALESAARKAANDLKLKSDALHTSLSSAQVQQIHVCSSM